MTILYVETNFPMSVATGRDPGAARLLGDASFRLVMPVVCLIEALSALESERKALEGFKRSLTGQITQAERDATSGHAGPLRDSLRTALGQASDRFNDVESRFFDALIRASEWETIGAGPEVVRASVDRPLIRRDLTDNLILHCILSHAAAHPGEVRAFLSGNTRDFGTPEVKAALNTAGVTKLFAEAGSFLDWHASQAP